MSNPATLRELADTWNHESDSYFAGCKNEPNPLPCRKECRRCQLEVFMAASGTEAAPRQCGNCGAYEESGGVCRDQCVACGTWLPERKPAQAAASPEGEGRETHLRCICGHQRGDHGGMGPSRGRSGFSCCCIEGCKCPQWRPSKKASRESQAFGWNVEQILVYIWQSVAGEGASEQEYPFAKFSSSEGGKRLRIELNDLALRQSAAPSGGTEQAWEKFRKKSWPDRKEEWSHHWKDVAIDFAVWLAQESKTGAVTETK